MQNANEHNDFLEQRRSGIGGSDIAAIMGLSKFKTAFDVYQSKIAPQKEQNAEHFYWGHALEPVIATRFSQETGYPIFRQPEIRQHPQHEWAIANADGLILDPETQEPIGILEIKTSSAYKSNAWSEDGDAEKIPVEYFAQVQWYLEIFDLEIAYLAVLIGGNQYRHYEIQRDRDIAQNLLAYGKQFWHEHVLKHIAPAPQNAADVLKIFPIDDGNSKEADNEALSVYQLLLDLKTQANEIKEKIEEAENTLKHKIGESTQLNHNGQKLCTWKHQTRKSFDSKAFQAAYPDVYAQFLTQSETRILRLSRV